MIKWLKSIFRPSDPFMYYEKELQFLKACDPNGLMFNKKHPRVPLCSLPYLTRVGKIFGMGIVESIITNVYNSPFRDMFFVDLMQFMDRKETLDVYHQGNYTDHAKAIYFARFLCEYWDDSTDKYLWYSQLRFGLRTMSTARSKIKVVTENRKA